MHSHTIRTSPPNLDNKFGKMVVYNTHLSHVASFFEMSAMAAKRIILQWEQNYQATFACLVKNMEYVDLPRFSLATTCSNCSFGVYQQPTNSETHQEVCLQRQCHWAAHYSWPAVCWWMKPSLWARCPDCQETSVGPSLARLLGLQQLSVNSAIVTRHSVMRYTRHFMQNNDIRPHLGICDKRSIMNSDITPLLHNIKSTNNNLLKGIFQRVLLILFLF